MLLMYSCAAPVGKPLPTPLATGEPLVIYAPGTPASIPIHMAARRMFADGITADVTIFTDHSKASALFLRGDVTILVTGLPVGVEFFKNGMPVQVINSYVGGLTYLVTYGRQVDRLSDLKGQEVYIPFEGSPIEEITRFFAEQEGLTWKEDIRPVYSPFTSSVELLKQGKATAVALPEPYVSLVEDQPNVFISLNYKEKWDSLTGSSNGYPQVNAFVKRDWAASHADLITRFNDELANALQHTEQDPVAALEQTKAEMGFPPQVLLASLRRTDWSFSRSEDLAHSIRHYYQIIGKPLDEPFEAFFYYDHK